MDRKQQPMVIRPWNSGRPHAPAPGSTAPKTGASPFRRKNLTKRSKP